MFATGITVVTVTAADGTPHGLTANSFTSVSAEPPLILVCIDLRCRLLEHFRDRDWFAVNVLSEHQTAISSRFSELPDARFEGVPWRHGITAIPLLNDAVAVFECRKWRLDEAGDHAMLIGEVAHAETVQVNPLIYFASSYRRLSS